MSKLDTRSKIGKNGKYLFQNVIETILLKHGIQEKDLGKEWYLKIGNKPYLDLVMEKCGSQIFAGHYNRQNEDSISDPILVFDYNNGFWYPELIEQRPLHFINGPYISGITIVSKIDENGKRRVSPYNKDSFDSFQRMFAINLINQGFMDDETEVIDTEFPDPEQSIPATIFNYKYQNPNVHQTTLFCF